MSNNSKKILLEVERKFSHLNCNPLSKNGGIPHFRALRPIKTEKFRDVYFDNDKQLSSAGTWVRQRNGIWQMKLRRGGDFNHSKFQETSDIVVISDHVSNITSTAKYSSESTAKNFGLSPVADITTTRQSWKADGRFKIVFDRTEWGHTVGEVELELNIDAEMIYESGAIMNKMDEEVVNFLRRYSWAFGGGRPVGKLSAYFARKSELNNSQTSASLSNTGGYATWMPHPLDSPDHDERHETHLYLDCPRCNRELDEITHCEDCGGKLEDGRCDCFDGRFENCRGGHCDRCGRKYEDCRCCDDWFEDDRCDRCG